MATSLVCFAGEFPHVQCTARSRVLLGLTWAMFVPGTCAGSLASMQHRRASAMHGLHGDQGSLVLSVVTMIVSLGD